MDSAAGTLKRCRSSLGKMQCSDGGNAAMAVIAAMASNGGKQVMAAVDGQRHVAHVVAKHCWIDVVLDAIHQQQPEETGGTHEAAAARFRDARSGCMNRCQR
eukprot:1158983-Pelagomonas_calceolata.AAC.3